MTDIVGTRQWERVLKKVVDGHDRFESTNKVFTYITYSTIKPILFTTEPVYQLLILQSPYIVGERQYREILAWLDQRGVVKELFRPRKMQCWLFARLEPDMMMEFRIRWL